MIMEGHNLLAGFFTANPELAIVRNFNALIFRDLIYRQSEVTHLEADLKQVVREDSKSKEPPRSLFQKNVGVLLGPHDNEDVDVHRKIHVKLQERLREYRMNLLA